MAMPPELQNDAEGEMPPELQGEGEQAPAQKDAGGDKLAIPAEVLPPILRGAKAGDSFTVDVADVASDGTLTVNVR